jgi:geranylgeranyl diphosphate synthase type II
MQQVARAVGTVEGIVAGQAWEFETNVDVQEYHRAKTGSLFVAAAACGAVSAGADPVEWARLGGLIGAAYQIGDDIADLISNSADTGKSSQIDARMGRPNMALSLGVDESVERLTGLLDSALACVPACAHRQAFRNWLTEVTQNTMMTRLGLKNIKRCRN